MDKCFTTSNDAVYVIYLHWPTEPGSSPHTALVSLDHLVPTAATTVSLLGDPRTAITHSVTGGRFEFEVPDTSPAALRCELDLCHAFVFKVTR